MIVIDKSGVESTIDNVETRYKFPHMEIGASQKLSIITETQLKAIDKGRDPSKAIEKFRKSNGIYDVYSTAEIINKFRFNQDEKILIEKYCTTAYGYFAYSTEVWDKLNDGKAKLRKGLRILRGGFRSLITICHKVI